MRKGLLTLAVAVLAMLQTAWAYDFSATSPSGHTLYYEIIGTTNVGVVRPGTDSIYNNYISGSVVIPTTVAYNGTTYNVTELRPILDSSSNSYYGSFESCSGLTSVTIPNSIAVIGDWAFGGCSSLTSITIPDSVTYIGVGAFYDCTGLTSINIPNNVDAIHDCTFSNCTGLTSVTIPNSVTSIGDRIWNPYPGAFDGCTGLTSITIPNSVATIGNLAFRNCSGLTSITIPNSVTSIGESAFAYCSGLTSVTIGNSVTSIGEGAFYYCSGLTSVTIPNSVTSIGYEAFKYCSGLTSVTIGNSVTSIGDYAFSGCSGLTTLNFNAINCSDFYSGSYHPFYNCPIATINIGDSVQRIPACFAYYLDSLTSVTIGNSVTSIGIWAFNGCTNLRDVTSLAVTPPTLGTTVFSAAGILKVPCGSLSAYRYSAWLDYFTIMEEICDNMTITVTSANESMGTVSGSGEYAFGTVATITAIPNEGYRFVSWNDGNTDNPRTITVTEDATYIASFEEGVGIESRDMLSELAFYPNPTSGIITFNRSDIMKVEVLDAMGRIVAVYENAYTIDISKLAKGYYAMRITTAEGVAVRKVIRK